MNQDELYMQRALELAAQGMGRTSPNPMVGAVLVKDGVILAEGFHQRAGTAHAEVDALNKLPPDTDLRNATLYVTLEPCTHFGRTPPCCDLILQRGIGRVVIAASDPNPKTARKAAGRLTAAGVTVIEGVLATESEQLNKRYYTNHRSRRPYIILKWAQTADGFIARTDGSSKWISSDEARAEVHRIRGIEDGILVGTQTALIDNPQLTARGETGSNPVRIVFDRALKIPRTYNLYNNEAMTIVVNSVRANEEDHISFLQHAADAPLEQLLEELLRREICSILVEGGTNTLQRFINQQLWDEALIFTSSETFASGIPAPTITGSLTSSRTFGSTTARWYTPDLT